MTRNSESISVQNVVDVKLRRERLTPRTVEQLKTLFTLKNKQLTASAERQAQRILVISLLENFRAVTA